MFSSRLPPRLDPNPLSLVVARLTAAGTPILDLTETNPSAVGLVYPSSLLFVLGDSAGNRYAPDPLGMRDARASVANAYAASGHLVDPAHVLITASTSEAYSILFKLLADPGNEILIPTPSYPLFDVLATLDAVKPVPYRLRAADGWSIDRESVTDGMSASTRAILVVSPNNPTGSCLHEADAAWLTAFAAEKRVALIVDEVFADYPLSPGAGGTSLIENDRGLTFTLGGLSKSAGLPQVKLAWVVVSGPQTLVAEAMARLAIINDTYLSASTPVQQSAGHLIESGAGVRRMIQQRLERNLASLRARVAEAPALTLLEPEAGWSAVLRVPAVMSEEALVMRLLEEASVRVHPGYFFDFTDEAFLVLSLLPAPEVFDEGISRLAATIAGVAA